MIKLQQYLVIVLIIIIIIIIIIINIFTRHYDQIAAIPVGATPWLGS